MSFDIDLHDPRSWEHRKTCDGGWDPVAKEYRDHECVGHVVTVGNMTYNVSPMWADALGHVGETNPFFAFLNGETAVGIRAFEGAPCVEAAGPLRAAVESMKADPEHYRAMNPPNGWGNYEGALAYLERMQRLCETYPEYRIHIG